METIERALYARAARHCFPGVACGSEQEHKEETKFFLSFTSAPASRVYHDHRLNVQVMFPPSIVSEKWHQIGYFASILVYNMSIISYVFYLFLEYCSSPAVSSNHGSSRIIRTQVRIIRDARKSKRKEWVMFNPKST